MDASRARRSCAWSEADEPVGEGAGWTADRTVAARLRDGKPVEEISLEEARRIAEAVGEPVPPQVSPPDGGAASEPTV